MPVCKVLLNTSECSYPSVEEMVAQRRYENNTTINIITPDEASYGVCREGNGINVLLKLIGQAQNRYFGSRYDGNFRSWEGILAWSRKW